jgi:hypothetical protein
VEKEEEEGKSRKKAAKKGIMSSRTFSSHGTNQ